MTKTLSQILSDGSLVDNTVHQASEGVFQGAWNSRAVEIYRGYGRQNNPDYAWTFARTAAQQAIDPSRVVTVRPDGEYEHNTNDPLVSLSGLDSLNFSLTTGNVIGSMNSDDFTLRVSSRFGDEFLRFIIADADGFVEVPDRGGMADGSYEWLLIHLWLVKLKKAMRLGLPKGYETRSESLTQVRGQLDVVDYQINQKLGRHTCAYREHSYDNPATRLIARTLEHLDSRSKLSGDHSLRQTFLAATGGQRHPLQDLLRAPALRNPYFADYNPVMTMAKRILHGDLLDFGVQDRSSSFFFDVSMLWEHFIRQLLRRAGFTMRDKNSSTMPVSQGIPGATRRLIPDLVFNYEGRNFVFDVKYKNFPFGGPSPGVKREDLFQLHTYVGQASNEFDVSGCGLIYPVHESKWHDQALARTGGILSSRLTQGRREIPFHVGFLMIPESSSSLETDRPDPFQHRFQRAIDSFVRNMALACMGNHENAIGASVHSPRISVSSSL